MEMEGIPLTTDRLDLCAREGGSGGEEHLFKLGIGLEEIIDARAMWNRYFLGNR
jgi:hypothetical protein